MGLLLPFGKPEPGTPLDPLDPINRLRVCALLMGDGRGQKAYDASGHQYHGTLNQTGYPWAPSHHGGQALKFNGSTDYVVITEANAPLLDITGSELSFGIWVYPTGSAQYQTLVAKSAGSTRQYAAYFVAGNVNQIFIAISGTSIGTPGNVGEPLTLSNPWIIGAWNRVDIAYKIGDFKIFLNRKIAFSRGDAGTITHLASDISFGAQSVDNSLHIAGAADGADIWQRCISFAEHCRIYDEGFAGFLQNDTTDYRVITAGGGSTVLSRYYYDEHIARAA